MIRLRSLLLLSLLLVFQAVQAQTLTLEQRLKALPDVYSVKKMESNEFFKQAWVVMVAQPLDHQHPDKGFFTQRVIVSHLGYDKPVVFITEGYAGDYAATPKYLNELSLVLDANQIFVEHRFFGQSVPDSIDAKWKYLTVENAAADDHHLVQMFKKIYHDKWISTGISKGGETCLYHRALYPKDVDISVPYVAPLNFSREERREPAFIEHITGTKEGRAKVAAFQRQVLERRDQLFPMFQTLCDEKKYTFRIPLEAVYDYCVLEYSFSFWQWGHDIDEIPAPDAPDQEIFDHFVQVSSPEYFSIEGSKGFLPFFVQAARQLGYYAYDMKPFADLMTIKSTEGYLTRIWLPKEARFPFSSAMSEKVDKYLRSDARHILLIYGGWDPWSASAAEAGKNKGVMKIVKPEGSHRTRIMNLPDNLRQQAIDTLKVWLSE